MSESMLSPLPPSVPARDSSPGAAEYLTFARTGEAGALEQALRACADRAYTQARRHLGNAADADDAVQEAFLQLARSAGRYDGSIPFAAWVGRLVQIACLRHRRSEQRRRRREEHAITRSRPDPEAHSVSEQVRSGVLRLPHADQVVIDLHYFAGLSQAEVAAALGRSENAIALRLSRARARLRTLLGGSASAASILALLAAQPAYAAPPQVLATISALTTTIAAGGTLPATTLSLPLAQKGLLFMTTHPLLTALCAGLLVLAGLLPAVLWSADSVPPADTPPVVAVEQPWRGKVRELLPFIEPTAPARAAVDWGFLRRDALEVRPTSLLADPRAATAVAHVREQFRLWHVNGGGMPDWVALFATADGAVASLDGRVKLAGSFVAEVGETGATAIQTLVDSTFDRQWQHELPTLQIGPFTGRGVPTEVLLGHAGSRWAMATPSHLQAGLDRSGDPVTPPTAPLWAEATGADAIATLAALDHDRSDPLGLAAWLGPDWRSAQPSIRLETTRDGDRWRTTTVLSGLANFPLRAPSPAIAGCVPEDALASLVFGIDWEQAAPLAAIDPTVLMAVTRRMQQIGIDPVRLRDALRGDIAVVAQAQAPIPAFTIVLGLHPDMTDMVRQTIESLPFELAPVAVNDQPQRIASWDRITPVGLVQICLTHDRIVISTGDPSPFIAPPERPTTAALAVDVDLPALARSYLPMLFVMIPNETMYFNEASSMKEVISLLGQFPDLYAVVEKAPATILPPRNLDTLQPMRQMQQIPRDGVLQRVDFGPILMAQLRTHWSRLSGQTDMQPYLAYYIGTDTLSFSKRLLVLRTPKGWMAITPWLNSIDTFADLAALQPRLAGMALAAGTEPAALQVLELNDQPSFDRRWLPPPATICDHLPRYRLRLDLQAGDWRMIEDGLPMLGATAVIVAMAPQLEPRLLPRLYHEVVLRRDGPALTAKHRTAMAALKRAQIAMRERPPAAKPVLTPSQLLAAAKVPLADLASLTDGTVPTAEQVDRLGFWHPTTWPHHHFSWVIPVDQHVFLEIAWWTSGPELTMEPRTPQRPPTDAELQRVMDQGARRSGQHPEAPPPEPTPAVIDDF